MSDSVRSLFTLYHISFGLLADNRTVVTVNHNEARPWGIIDAADSDGRRMVYQSCGSKLKKFGFLYFKENRMEFQPDYSHNWHVSPICLTCNEEEFHKEECSERLVTNLVTGGGIDGGMKVSSTKPLLAPRSSKRCDHGEVLHDSFPKPIRSCFNEIIQVLYEESMHCKQKSTETSIEYCERRQMHLAGLSRQFWMDRSNLTVLHTLDIQYLHSILSIAIGSLTEEEGHQVYARAHLVLYLTMRSLLQPVHEATLNEDLLVSATDPGMLIYLHSKRACSCLESMVVEARDGGEDVSDQKSIIKPVKCQVIACYFVFG
jgi:hypothetical protein